MPTSREQLAEWLVEPEGAHLEFKEAKQNFHFDKLVECCVALANEGGGRIILGVTDRRPRRIVGTTAFGEPGRAEAGLHERLAHRIPVEELRTSEGRVLVVHVPGRLPGTAWEIGGRYLKRAGDGLVALSDAELRAMFAETGPDFSAETCPRASASDLSPEAIESFRARWAAKTRDERKARWTDEQTLANAELLIEGRITYAALILFGTRRALGDWLAQAELVFEYRSSEASAPPRIAKSSARDSFSGKTQSGTRSTCAMIVKATRTGCSASNCPPSTRWQCAKRCSTRWRIVTIGSAARSSCGSTPNGWKR